VQVPPLLPHAVPAATLHRLPRVAVSVDVTDTTTVVSSVVVTVTVDVESSTKATRVLYVDVATSAASRLVSVRSMVNVVSMALGANGGGDAGGGEGGATRMCVCMMSVELCNLRRRRVVTVQVPIVPM